MIYIPNTPQAALTLTQVFSAIVSRLLLSLSIWTLIIVVLLLWNLGNLDDRTRELAISEARAHLTKNKALQDWASQHGGLYVIPNEFTTPSPYLKFLPHRDLKTVDGTSLTLMNPAYIIRQMMQVYEERYGVRGSITGKVTLNPDNRADEWQLAALNRFENDGLQELYEQRSINGKSYMSYMKPLYMEDSCMQCHGQLGFKVGDLRGALGIDVPLQPFIQSASVSRSTMYITAVILWLLGAVTILMLLSISYKRKVLQQAYHNRLEQEHSYLEMRVQERTTELETAKQQADKANMAKSQFLSRMSHELRTPLNAILGFAQLMKMDKEKQTSDEEHDESVDEILKAGDHLLELINEVLDLSHIESGKMDINLVDMDIQEIVDSCVSLMRPHAEKRHININNRIRTQGCLINVDAKFLRQVLMNLLSNAIKYNHEGGEVSLNIERHSESQCKLLVADTGEGIPENMIERIFDPFDRLGRGDEEEGSGIGLTVCQRLVQSMGGDIGVRSTLGKGSEFWVLLKLSSST